MKQNASPSTARFRSAAVPVLGGILIAGLLLVLILWGVARGMPYFLAFVDSRWARALPLVAMLFIILNGGMFLRRRRAAKRSH